MPHPCRKKTELRTFSVTCLSLLLICGWILTSCAAHGGTIQKPSTTAVLYLRSVKPVTWVMNRAALDRLLAAGLPASTLKHFFDNNHTYIIGQMPNGWQSISTLSFSSYASLKKAFDANTIPASVQAILYDNEAWTFTPREEQLHFSTYVKEVADLVHSHQKVLIAAPATDLVRVLDPNSQGDIYSHFLSLGILKAAAMYADLVEIQAQGAEANFAKYIQFVGEASAQAKAARSTVVVLAGLSTNPNGQNVTGQQLVAVFFATGNDVSGYWLNIPGDQGGYCPKCGTPQPQVAIDFLQSISPDIGP